MKCITIRDSTLREGIELPGVNLSLSEKMRIVELLDDMNIPEVEIGMPYGIRDCIPLAHTIRERRLKIKSSALILSYSSTWKGLKYYFLLRISYYV